MTNLYEETLWVLRYHEKDARDVIWVGDGVNSYTWGEFREAAYHFYYDKGYGIQEVKPKLVIVGDNWWLERREYDGSEWWEFVTRPTKPLDRKNKPELRLGAE